MKTIRRNTFETNSSSTHSLTLCEKDEYEGIGKTHFIYDSSDVKSIEEIKEFVMDNYKSVTEKDFDLLWKAFIDHLQDFKKLDIDPYDYDNTPEDIIHDEELEEGEYFKEYFALPVGLKEIFNKVMLNFMDLEIYDDQNGESGLEWYEHTYTTKKGEEIVAFGYYGYPY